MLYSFNVKIIFKSLFFVVVINLSSLKYRSLLMKNHVCEKPNSDHCNRLAFMRSRIGCQILEMCLLPHLILIQTLAQFCSHYATTPKYRRMQNSFGAIDQVIKFFAAHKCLLWLFCIKH